LVADELIKTLGERRAIEALVAAAYGNELDPSRYGPIVELQDRPLRGDRGDRSSDRGRAGSRFGGDFRDGRRFGEGREGRSGSLRERGGRDSDYRSSDGPHRRAAGDRVYIGVGRRHGVSARDVAGLLMRAGGVPGRLVDAIEVRDYCAYATLPAEAARRAYNFAKQDPDHPTIKPAGGRN
uniref:DbpA RNA binding domain-containing protein n=1 Tax=Gracilinema caldarium TaxID=215591 RepID=UPI0026EE58FE